MLLLQLKVLEEERSAQLGLLVIAAITDASTDIVRSPLSSSAERTTTGHTYATTPTPRPSGAPVVQVKLKKWWSMSSVNKPPMPISITYRLQMMPAFSDL